MWLHAMRVKYSPGWWSRNNNKHSPGIKTDLKALEKHEYVHAILYTIPFYVGLYFTLHFIYCLEYVPIDSHNDICYPTGKLNWNLLMFVFVLVQKWFERKKGTYCKAFF